jgi:hypothetical protein
MSIGGIGAPHIYGTNSNQIRQDPTPRPEEDDHESIWQNVYAPDPEPRPEPE